MWKHMNDTAEAARILELVGVHSGKRFEAQRMLLAGRVQTVWKDLTEFEAEAMAVKAGLLRRGHRSPGAALAAMIRDVLRGDDKEWKGYVKGPRRSYPGAQDHANYQEQRDSAWQNANPEWLEAEKRRRIFSIIHSRETGGQECRERSAYEVCIDRAAKATGYDADACLKFYRQECRKLGIPPVFSSKGRYIGWKKMK